MSRPDEAIELDDFDADDDYEYEDSWRHNGSSWWNAGLRRTLGGGEIQTPADRSSVRRRGSVEFGDDLTLEDIGNIKKLTQDIDSEEELTNRLRELGRDRITDLDPSLLNEQLLLDNILEINTKLSTRWKEYVEKKLYHKFELEGGGTFKSGTKWSLTDKGIFVEYPKGRKTQLTVAGNPRKFLKPSTISKKYGRGGTSFVRDILGVVDYSSASKKNTTTGGKNINFFKRFSKGR